MPKTFKDLLNDEYSGGEVTPPGLSFAKIVSDIGKELKHQAEFGAHEAAAALFRGDAFVMYPKQEGVEQEAPLHGLPQQQENVQEHDGRER